MSDFKDLFLLFICAFSNGFYFCHGFTITYHISYIKHFHSYTIAKIFSTVIFLDIGLLFSGIIFPQSVKKIGLNNCFRFYSIVCALVMLIFIYFTNIWMVSLGYFLIGYCHQLINMSIIYSLNMKFKDNLVKYTGYVFTGTSASCIFWAYLTYRIINPNNQVKTETQILSGGEIEKYFSYDIAVNLQTFFFIYGLVNVICPLITSIFFSLNINDPDESLIDDSNKDTINNSQNLVEQSMYNTRNIAGIQSSFYYKIMSKY